MLKEWRIIPKHKKIVFTQPFADDLILTKTKKKTSYFFLDFVILSLICILPFTGLFSQETAITD